MKHKYVYYYKLQLVSNNRINFVFKNIIKWRFMIFRMIVK